MASFSHFMALFYKDLFTNPLLCFIVIKRFLMTIRETHFLPLHFLHLNGTITIDKAFFFTDIYFLFCLIPHNGPLKGSLELFHIFIFSYFILLVKGD
jgi:hypothetical protein